MISDAPKFGAVSSLSRGIVLNTLMQSESYEKVTSKPIFELSFTSRAIYIIAYNAYCMEMNGKVRKGTIFQSGAVSDATFFPNSCTSIRNAIAEVKIHPEM